MVREPRSISPRNRTTPLLAKILILAAVLVFAIGCWSVWQQWQANKQATRRAATVTNSGNSVALPNEAVPPSTTKSPQSEFDSYQVGATKPRYIFIPSISVKAIIKEVGLTGSGAIGTPANVFDTAWYNGSSEPGNPGATVIDGHVSSWQTDGVFYNLKLLKPGDLIQIERGDGKIISYKVIESKTYPVAMVDIPALLSPVGSAKSGLNLITCTGDVIKGSNEFNERIIVFAEMI